jgi:glycosyltransferase involved in cell wall biosynthesis
MEVPEEKVSVIGEALYDVFSPVSREDALPVRTKYGLQGNYLLFVSLLYPYKNAKTVIAALVELLSRGKNLNLAIVGSDVDNQKAKLENLALSLGISNQVKFLGRVSLEDLPALYSSAEVFVFPSLVETFGKPLVEAMQCGTPVVASNASCIPEVLNGAGLLVNPLDPTEMASAIERILDDRELRQDLVNRGLSRAQDFRWERGAEQTLNLIERTFEGWKTPIEQPHVGNGG